MSAARRLSTCRDCRQPILIVPQWSLDDPTKRGFMPLDPDEYPRGDARATWAVSGFSHRKGRALRKG